MENEKVIKLTPNHLERIDMESCDEEPDCACEDGCDCDSCGGAESAPNQLVIDEQFRKLIEGYAVREIRIALGTLTNPQHLQALYPDATQDDIVELIEAYTKFYDSLYEIITDILDRFEGQDVSILADAIVGLQALISLQPISPITGKEEEWEEIPTNSGLFNELRKLFGSKWREEIETIQHNIRANSIYRFDHDNEAAFRIDGTIFQTPTRQYVSEDSIVFIEFPYDFRPGTVQSVPDEDEKTE